MSAGLYLLHRWEGFTQHNSWRCPEGQVPQLCNGYSAMKHPPESPLTVHHVPILNSWSSHCERAQGLRSHILLCWVFGSSPNSFVWLGCTFKMPGRGGWDTDAQMCNESIKACAVVLGTCAVPMVCQTLIIILTPAACLQFNPGCFFPAWSARF